MLDLHFNFKKLVPTSGIAALRAATPAWFHCGYDAIFAAETCEKIFVAQPQRFSHVSPAF